MLLAPAAANAGTQYNGAPAVTWATPSSQFGADFNYLSNNLRYPTGFQQVLPGTSPVTATISGGSRVEAYQGTDHLLHVFYNGIYTTISGFSLMAGTSPAITGLVSGSGGSGFELVVVGSNGYVYSESGVWAAFTLIGGPVMTGTGVSIAGLQNGGGAYEVAWQGNDGRLHANGFGSGSSTSPTAVGYGLAPGTTPAIAGVGNGYEIAFQANTGALYTVGVGAGTVNHGAWSNKGMNLQMKAGTSPAITGIVPSGYRVAFQNNAGDLWVVGEGTSLGSNLYYFDTTQPVRSGTSPAITGFWQGGFEIAVQTPNGQLWESGQGAGSVVYNTRSYTMYPGTSPSLS